MRREGGGGGRGDAGQERRDSTRHGLSPVERTSLNTSPTDMAGGMLREQRGGNPRAHMAGWIVAEFDRGCRNGLFSLEKMRLPSFSHATIPSRRGNPGPSVDLVAKEMR